MMGGPLPELPGGPLTSFAGLLGAGTAMFFWFKRKLRKEGMNAQSDGAIKDVLIIVREQARLAYEQSAKDREQLESYRLEAEKDRRKAEQAIAALHEATSEMRSMQQKIVELTLEVERLRAKLDSRIYG